jgi:hypothetical protein
MSTQRHGGYPIGTRRESAEILAKRNEERARVAWMDNIPHEPQKLLAVLREAGVDLDGLRRALR